MILIGGCPVLSSVTCVLVAPAAFPAQAAAPAAGSAGHAGCAPAAATAKETCSAASFSAVPATAGSASSQHAITSRTRAGVRRRPRRRGGRRARLSAKRSWLARRPGRPARVSGSGAAAASTSARRRDQTSEKRTGCGRR